MRRRSRRPESPGAPTGPHVAVLVENVSLAVDTRLRKQVSDLLGAGYRVSVVTRTDPDNGRYRTTPGLTVLEYPVPADRAGVAGYVLEYLVSFFWAALLSLRLRLRGRIDVLQVCQPPDVYFPLCWLLRWLGARIVVDQRDLMPEVFAARYDQPRPAMMAALRWLERRSQRVADETLCVNEYLRDRLVAAGAAPERVSVIRNGPVLERVERAVPDAGLKGEHRFLVCWIGKMGRQDRVDLVIRVAECLVRDHGRTDCGFAVLGDGECLAELRSLTAELGLQQWVHFPGWLPEDQVFGYLASADLGIDTSLQEEVSPVKAMEYMAHGLPVICFDLQETRRITAGAAVLVRPADTDALAKELLTLLDDPRARNRLGSVGRRRVREELSWERQVVGYLAAIQRAAASDARTTAHG
jgi:glycosyltransferase involved in cell wall biosynthesis